ncbi:group I truncated hemoglobin [Neobacillus niacini]|uniref:group I truncated hemoglobin n=1 Tax=Neobacillus niacini TaxID=86668 RepID=UPI003B029263
MHINEDKITSVVKEFFHKIHADDLMSKFFKDHDQERIQHHPQTFLEHGLGGGKYSNEQIANAHKDLPINDEHFEAMIGNFMATLNEHEFSEEDKQKVHEILQGHKGNIIGK